MFRYHPRVQSRVASANTSRVQRRSVVHATSLSGIHSHFGKNNLRKTFLRGMVLANLGGLENLYDVAIKQTKSTPMHDVIKSLFYKLGTGFRQTQNKSLPAFSLTPPLLGKIIHHLGDETLDTPNVRTKLLSEWKKIHLESTGNKISLKKADELLNCISAARKDDINTGDYLTEAVLFGFLYYRATTRQEILDCLLQLNELTPILDCELNPTQVFLHKDMEKIKKIISTMEIINDDKVAHIFNRYYEEIILTLLLENQHLQQVMQLSYGYEKLPVVPNCMEASIHNVCNFLLYDSEMNQFNFKLLPSSLPFNQAFYIFYETQKFRVTDINSRSTGQAFMNLISGKTDILKYRHEKYELTPTKKNLIAAINFLFGSTAISLEELSTQLSTNERQISFTLSSDKDENEDEDYCESTITITVKPNNDKSRKITLKLTKIHAETHSDFFLDKQKTNKKTKLLELANKYSQHDPSLLSLLTCNDDEGFANIIHSYCDDITKLNFIKKYLIPTTPNQAYALIKASTHYIKTDVEHQNDIVHLFKKFDPILHLAIEAEDYEIVTLALEMGVNIHAVNQFHESPLHVANNNLILSVLIKAGANVNAIDSYGMSPLQHAIGKDNIDKFKLLLKNHADPFALDANQNTLLVAATCHPEMLAELIQLGLDPNQTNKFGATPLSSMMYSKVDTRSLDILFKAGANPNSQDIDGRTALHKIAARDNQFTMIGAVIPLLANGANPNLADNLGNTPLHILCKAESHIDIANILLDAGADPLAKNLVGQTPVSMSKGKMKDLLERAINIKALSLNGFFKTSGKPETPEEKANKVMANALK